MQENKDLLIQLDEIQKILESSKKVSLHGGFVFYASKENIGKVQIELEKYIAKNTDSNIQNDITFLEFPNCIDNKDVEDCIYIIEKEQKQIKVIYEREGVEYVYNR